jgi:riboflavin kinase / FMN adenylyltransferase
MIWVRAEQQDIADISKNQIEHVVENGSVITFGNFDGLHLGHRNLLQDVTLSATKLNLPAVVFTFKPHPRMVLNPELPFHRMFDHSDQFEILCQLGVTVLFEEKFTKALSEISARDFFIKYVVQMFRAKHVVVGYDFSFGRKREGNLDFLQSICHEFGVQLTIKRPYSIDGQIVSSSTIRRFLQHGEVQLAEQFLGRKYYLRGVIQKAFQRGRQIGVPTANIHPDIYFLPRQGVYFTQCRLQDRVYNSITNIGFNPTFQSRNPDDIGQMKVETHIFDFNQDVYGENLTVELINFCRDEIKFSSIDHLKEQIHKDLQQARAFFANR